MYGCAPVADEPADAKDLQESEGAMGEGAVGEDCPGDAALNDDSGQGAGNGMIVDPQVLRLFACRNMSDVLFGAV